MADTTSLVPRRVIAITALISGIVALYLHLWKLGLAGTLACGGGHGCQVVQFSPWSWFLGFDVALIGTVGYALILLTALVGIQERWASNRWVTIVLALLIVPAFIFTLRLKYYEFFVLGTFCPWCAISAVTITMHLVLVAFDWRRVRSQGAR